MTSMRRPKPRKTPSTLRELVLDLEARMEGGDAASDVWLPGTDWVTLCAAAEAEARAVERRIDELERRSPTTGETDAELAARGVAPGLGAHRPLEVDAHGVGKFSIAFVAALERLRHELATALGCGVDTEPDDLVEIARGYVAALDAERQRAQSAEEASSILLEEDDEAPATTKKAGPGRLRCPRCLGPCPNEGDRCVRSAGATRLKELRQLTPEHRSDLAIDHPEWFCERGRARGCALQADHAGDCMMFSELEAFEGPEEPEAEHPECLHCGEADGHKPNECAMNVDSDAALAADSGRRLNGAGWKREAKEAREKNALDACHHCGVGEDFGDELLAVRNDESLPDGVFCKGCRIRLAKNPAEWERHGPPTPTMVESLERAEKEAAAKKPRKQKSQTTLDEAIEAATPHREVHRAPRRATKKFPAGARDLAEKCTACGAELGAHAGTKCPPKNRRRLRIEDVPAEVA